MPRSVQLDHMATAPSATSMTAATSPWKRSVRAERRVVAASFSAGDSRSHHQHMLAFEQQLDAIVGGVEATTSQEQQHFFSSSEMEQLVRGTLERSVSTSSSIGFQSGASERSAGKKITGRRHRTPRQFVVTDIPDFQEFNRMSPSTSGEPNEEQRGSQTGSQPRQGRTEVKGRFTIIDLSPNSNVHPEFPTLPVRSASQHQVTYHEPVDSPSRARRADLSAFDRHLDYLQKESSGMKSLLEGMVSTNARWISALSQAGVTFPRTLSDSTLNCSFTSLSEAVSPLEPEPSPVFGSAPDEKFAAMKLAYEELQKKHESLLAKNKQLEEQNLELRSRLQEQTQVSDDLRAQLQQFSDSEPSHGGGSDLTSVFGDVDDQLQSGVESSPDYENNQVTAKSAVSRRRRRCYSADEECMSDTSSEGSLSKSPASAIPAWTERRWRDFCACGAFHSDYCFAA
ncbi:hypothetical protein Gpo141_00012062 [Globisporangium polare]